MLGKKNAKGFFMNKCRKFKSLLKFVFRFWVLGSNLGFDFAFWGFSFFWILSISSEFLLSVGTTDYSCSGNSWSLVKTAVSISVTTKFIMAPNLWNAPWDLKLRPKGVTAIRGGRFILVTGFWLTITNLLIVLQNDW